MRSKEYLLKGARLYAIVDRGLAKGAFLEVAKAAASAGADLIQLRDKDKDTSRVIKRAAAVKRIAKKRGIPFIMNDRMDVAAAVDADGLHIGQGDPDIALARKILGKGKIIGVSATRFKEALKAKMAGADYIGAGPVFATPIKNNVRPKGMGLLRRIRKLDIPCFGIGGIERGNVGRLTGEGFDKIAVIRAICAARRPYDAVRRLKGSLVQG